MGQKQRQRAARRDAMVLDDVPEELEVVEGQPDAADSQPAVEVVEKPADDGEEPLEVLKRQFEELKIERDAEQRRAQELEQRSREQAQQIEKHQGTELANHKAVLEQAYGVEERNLADAKRKYALAMREQNFDAAADAQNEMIRINGVMGQYANAYQELDRREKAPKPAPGPDDQFEAALTKLHPKIAKWAREHKADMLDPARQKLAYAADAMALAKGYQAGSDEYLDFLDDAMGYDASGPDSDLSGSDTGQQRRDPGQIAARTSKRAPAAPPSRNSAASGGRRRVFLTDDDLRQIESFRGQGVNVTKEEFARWKEDAQKSGALNGGQRERFHAKFTA